MTALLRDACDQYLAYQRDVRQVSPHTLTNYARDLSSFIDFCES
ncbi:MAG: tyrosine recombinase XerC, partial [Cellvibrionales bacterium]|nr:tyrosine recombinase XerC [Cellvibrionales bacterium]